jgi:hypothetical protein
MCLTTERACRTCGESKPLNGEYFYRSKYHEGGYNTECIECNVSKTLEIERKLRESNPSYDPNSTHEQERIATAKEYYRKKAITDLLKKGQHSCSRCKQVLPVSDFNKDSSSYSGYASYCNHCKKEGRKNV